MSKVSYLLSLKDTLEGRGEIRDTWTALGGITYNSNTKVYTKDNFFKIDCEGKLKDALIYCVNTYSVDHVKFVEIDWDNSTTEEVESMVTSSNGVMSPFFKVVLLGNEIPTEIEIPPILDFTPFTKLQNKDEVQIDDDELTIILTELGVPFLRIDELEYDRDTICKYMIKPALEDYFAYFPIVQEQCLGNFTGGQDFDILFPEGAHGGILYYVQGNNIGGPQFGQGAFALVREQMAYGGNIGSTFGSGVSYRKPVPGFTGMSNGVLDARIQGLQAAQGYSNLFRREKYRKVRKDGKIHAVGYSTIGGTLCAKWLFHSYDWNDVEFEQLEQVRNLAKAYILRNLGMLRSMIKSDLPGNIDFSLYNSRADSLEEKTIEKWKQSSTNYRFAIMRGGL